jgi:cell division protein FtsQ
MNGNGGIERERGAKELNLRPFATPKSKTVDGLDLSRGVEELFDEEPAMPDKHGSGYAEFVAAVAAAEAERKPSDREREFGARAKAAPDTRNFAQRRARPLTEREKLAMERRRRFNRFISICIAAVVVTAALLLTWFLLIVDKIEVTGNARFTGEEIVSASQLKTGRHIWVVNLAEAERNIEQNPYVESADIKRVYPDKLVISVTERTEAAVIVGLNAQAVIDPKGYVLTIGARADYTGLIQISGMGFGGYHVGQRLGEESDFNSRTLVALLAAIYSAGIEDEIAAVDMSNPLSVYMTTLKGLTLHIGQPDDLDNKLANYVAVLPKLAEMGIDTSGTLDLSAMGDPVYSSGRNNPEELEDTASPDESPLQESPSPTPGSGEPSPSPSPSATPGETKDSFSG